MRAFHVDAFEQRMHAGRRHRHRCIGRCAPRRDAREGAGDQALHTDPEAARFPDQRLQLLPVATEEDEAVAGVGLVAEFMFDHAHQGVDAPAHVLRIPRHEDPLHRREAQHRRLRQASAVASSAPARSGGMPLENVQRRPLRVVMVRWRRRPRRAEGWTISSMKPGMPPSYGRQAGGIWGRRTDTIVNVPEPSRS